MAEIAPGSQAPRVLLTDFDGKDLNIPGRSRLTLLTVFKASCPTCEWALPYVQRLHEKTSGGALEVMGVAEDDRATALEFAEETGLTFPIALESDPWPVANGYGLSTVPTMFLIDESGEILLSSPGFSKDDLLDVARRAAELDGEEPADPFDGDTTVPAFRPG